MRVKLIYFRRDGKRHLAAQYDSAQTSFADVLAEVRANSHAQGKCAGVSGRADCYHIVVEVEKRRAVVHASARADSNYYGRSNDVPETVKRY